MHVITWFLTAQVHFGSKSVLLREIVGNVFGLASALFGMRRLVAAWPVGIVGNVLLFTCYVGGVFHNPQDKDLWGQAGRQVFFGIVSVYGWIQWYRFRSRHDGGVGVRPRWATGRERLQLLGLAVVCYVVFFFVLRALASFGPQWDAWILTGSVLATYGMARGWVEFWLLWVAVDVVGVPLLWTSGFYPSAVMYIIYGGFCIAGFVAWRRIGRRESAIAPGEPALAGAAGAPGSVDGAPGGDDDHYAGRR